MEFPLYYSIIFIFVISLNEQFPTVNFFFFAGNFCKLPGKYLNLPVGIWQKVGKSSAVEAEFYKDGSGV
jgi:hypothetical protein